VEFAGDVLHQSGFVGCESRQYVVFELAVADETVEDVLTVLQALDEVLVDMQLVDGLVDIGVEEIRQRLLLAVFRINLHKGLQRPQPLPMTLQKPHQRISKLPHRLRMPLTIRQIINKSKHRRLRPILHTSQLLYIPANELEARAHNHGLFEFGDGLDAFADVAV
jgi:hypothetical protein